MKHLELAKWQVGDILPTTSMAPSAAIIRARTWKGKPIFDMRLSTHTAIVVDRGGGLLYACEMGPWGIRMRELQAYDHGPRSWLDHPCCLLRHALMSSGDDGLELRNKVNDYCIRLHSFHVRYGYEDLMRFLWPEMPDDPNAMVCSQLAVSVLDYVGITLPDKWMIVNESARWPGLVSPADIQRWDGLKPVEGAIR